MEDKLYSQFLQLRKDGRKVKRWWFNTWAKQLMADLYHDIKDFKHSDLQWPVSATRNEREKCILA